MEAVHCHPVRLTGGSPHRLGTVAENTVKFTAKVPAAERSRCSTSSIALQQRRDPPDLECRKQHASGQQADRGAVPFHAEASIAGLRQGETRLHVSDIEHHVDQPDQQGRNTGPGSDLRQGAPDHLKQADLFHKGGVDLSDSACKNPETA